MLHARVFPDRKLNKSDKLGSFGGGFDSRRLHRTCLGVSGLDAGANRFFVNPLSMRNFLFDDGGVPKRRRARLC